MSSLYTKIKKNFVKAFVRLGHITPRAGRKAGSMNMLRRFASFGGTRSRAYGAGLTAILMAATLSLLAACGGGGGGGTVVTPHDAAVTIGSTNPADGATEVALDKELKVNFAIGSYSVFKQATPTLTCGGDDVPSTFIREGNSIITTATGELPVEKTCTLHLEVVVASSDGGKDATASTDVNFTTRGALHYGERVYAGTGKLPIRIIQKGDGTFDVERTADLSDQVSGDNEYTHCARHINENFFNDGRKLWNCRDIAKVWRNLALDPVENTFRDYKGAAPARAIPDDPNWVEVQTPLGGWANHTQTTAGWYYTLDDTGVLLFDDNGAGSAVTVFSGDQLKLEEAIRSLVTYSNP